MGALLLAMIAAGIHMGALGNGFVFDDIQIIEQNPLVTEPGRIGEIATSHYWHPLRLRGYLYRPLTVLSFRTDYLLGRGSPALFHATNILLHAAVSVAVFIALTLVFTRRAERAGIATDRGVLNTAFLAALFFATHPVHSEAVLGIANRGDLLAALLGTIAWISHMRGLSWVAGGTFLAALLSKESVVALPAVLVLSDWACGMQTSRARALAWSLRRYGPITVAALIYVALRLVVLDAPLGGDTNLIHAMDNPAAAAPAISRVATALKVLALEARLLVFPVRLSADYSYNEVPVVDGLSDAGALSGLFLLAASMTLAWRFRKRPLGPAFPVLFFLVTLAPVSNLLVPIGTIMAERTLYWPSIGFCAGLALLLRAVAIPIAGGRVGRVAMTMGLVIGALFAARTILRVPDWKDNIALFRSTTGVSSRSAKAAHTLGMNLMLEGDNGSAVPWLQRAVSNARGMPEGRADMMLDLSIGLVLSDRLSEAEDILEEARRTEPGHSGVLLNLGNLVAARGELFRANALYGEALDIEPDHPGILYNRGKIRLRLRRSGQAALDLEHATRAAPDWAEPLFSLANAYLATGRQQEAAVALRSFIDKAGSEHDAFVLQARRMLKSLEDSSP